jgi:uncharacterized protein YkwD
MIAIALVIAANMGVRWPDEVQRRIDTERAVLIELNRARTSPAALATSLRAERGYFQGTLLVRPGAEAAIQTEEGVAPVDEAIAYVAREAGEAPLAPAPLLAAAAADHQADQGGSGMVGHVGGDGSTPADRLRRRGGDGYVGEVIAYGNDDPAEIVRQLIVDDGVADRGHRRLLYDPSLRYAGVSCGTHPVYRYMCVVTLGRTPDGQPLRASAARWSAAGWSATPSPRVGKGHRS